MCPNILPSMLSAVAFAAGPFLLPVVPQASPVPGSGAGPSCIPPFILSVRAWPKAPSHPVQPDLFYQL